VATGARDFLLWQLVDSGFPAGGFAHSGGLETSVRHGHVHDSESLLAFARRAMVQAGHTGLPLVTAVHRNVGALGEHDALCDAFLSSPVTNRASRAQGRALLMSSARSFPHIEFASVETRVRREQLPGHYAPTFGAVLNVLGAGLVETQRLFIFLAGRCVASAAVRLGVIGTYEAQALQTTLSHDIDQIITTCEHLLPLDIAQTAPLIELCQSTHGRLYSRLFQS
jgi:urease accessory protein